MQLRRVSGATLIETLIVLMVVGLSSSIVAPRISDALQSMVFRSFSINLIQTLRRARNIAARSQQIAIVEIDLDANLIKSPQTSAQLSVPEAIDLQVTAVRLRDASEILSVRFFPDGASTGARFTLTLASRKIIIDVNWLTGQIKQYAHG